MHRVSARVDMNGAVYAIDAAPPDLFAAWLASLAGLFGRRSLPGYGARFSVQSLNVWDDTRPI